ncbi:MAG: hypothetical protein ACXADD_15095 [Candidatus Thorarchaeota archaeon]|jgi:hypothetical protein
MISKWSAGLALIYLGLYLIASVGSVYAVRTDPAPMTTAESESTNAESNVWISFKTSASTKDGDSTVTILVDQQGNEMKPKKCESPQSPINKSQSTSIDWIIHISQPLSISSLVMTDLDHVLLIATFLSSSNLFIAFYRIAKALEKGQRKKKTEDLRLRLIGFLLGLHAFVKYLKRLPIERRDTNIKALLKVPSSEQDLGFHPLRSFSC